MYAAFSWDVSPNSLNSAVIKQRVSDAIGLRRRAIVLSHFYVVELGSNADYVALAAELETVVQAFPGEVDYVVIQCGAEPAVFRPPPANRPGWNGAAISEIIS